jgi:hypothetical protein
VLQVVTQAAQHVDQYREAYALIPTIIKITSQTTTTEKRTTEPASPDNIAITLSQPAEVALTRHHAGVKRSFYDGSVTVRLTEDNYRFILGLRLSHSHLL